MDDTRSQSNNGENIMSPSVGLIQINVLDMSEARRFYIETLGFTELQLPMSVGSATALRNPYGPPILLYPVPHRMPSEYPLGTGATIVFHVDGIDRIRGEWSAKGVEFIRIAWSEEESGIAPCPFGRFIAFRDPSGNVHEILEPWPELAAGYAKGHEDTPR